MASCSSVLTGESHEQRSLAGYSPWDHTESDMTERLFHFQNNNGGDNNNNNNLEVQRVAA